jgi:Ca2+-transporting ATPase
VGVDGVSEAPVPAWVAPGDLWTIEARDVAVALESDPEAGLAPEEARVRLERHGPNELRARAIKPAWRLFVEQFTNAMILVLIGAAIITAAIGDLKDTAVILAIVALNGVVGFVQEYRAEKAMDALKRMTSPLTRVIRGGLTAVVRATELVPG